MEIKITNNKNLNRFEAPLDGDFAILEYMTYENGWALTHTYVPEEFRNQGIAGMLVHFAFEAAKSEHLKIIPACSAAEYYYDQHPEYEDVVDNDYEVE